MSGKIRDLEDEIDLLKEFSLKLPIYRRKFYEKRINFLEKVLKTSLSRKSKSSSGKNGLINGPVYKKKKKSKLLKQLDKIANKSTPRVILRKKKD